MKPEGKCKCGHPLHEQTCQYPVEFVYPDKPNEWLACGCFRNNGALPREWKNYYGES